MTTKENRIKSCKVVTNYYLSLCNRYKQKAFLAILLSVSSYFKFNMRGLKKRNEKSTYFRWN